MPDKKLTNYDRIRNMSIEEMAEFMYETNENCENFCAFTKDGKCNAFESGKQTCVIGIREWLESEVDTNAEIKKALECCANNPNDSVCYESKCPLFGQKCIDILSKNALDLINRQQAEIKRLELSNAMLTNNCDNKRQWIQHLEDEVRKLVFQHGPKGERGKNGMIATCPNCGRSHEDITWVADIDVCKCTCGWQSEPGECDYKKTSCYERELYGFAELMKQALPSWLHPVVDTVLKEMGNNIV